MHHPKLCNYCQLISQFVSKYQPMINQTLRSSANNNTSWLSIYSPNLGTLGSPPALSRSICRLHSFTFCQSRLLYIVVFLNKLLLCAIFSWRSYLALSREKQIILAMLDFSSVFMIEKAVSNYFFHHCCTSSSGCNIGTWNVPCQSTAPSLPTDPHLHPFHLTILCASWSTFWHCCKISCKRDNLWN